MSAAGVVQQKQRLRNHGVVHEAACKSLQAPMAKFFDEMLAHVRSLTGMRIPFLFVSTAFAGMIFAPAVLLLQLTVEDVTGTYDRIVDLVGNRTPSNLRRLLKADGALVAVSLPNPESEWVPCQLFRVLCFPCCCCCFCSQRFLPFMLEVRKCDLEELVSMLEAGTLRPAIV